MVKGHRESLRNKEVTSKNYPNMKKS